MTGNSSSNNSWILPALLSSGISVATILCGYWAVHQHEKYLRSKWLDEEAQKQKDNNREQDFEDGEPNTSTSLYSVIGHFKSLELSEQSTILEANRRRTTSYYEKAREAHEQSLVLGVPSYSKLLEKRKEELNRLLFYHKEGIRSLRTVIVMLDKMTQNVLSEARQKILQPLNYSWDIYHKGVWIPEMNMIPNEDMHVTVACPWWWHTMREGNDELNKELFNRCRQALVIDFHHPFFLELERFVLLGGKTLVALWRTVGDRVVETDENSDDIAVCDRHATTADPMVRLRREIVNCFTNDQHEHNFQPLTHQHKKWSDVGVNATTTTTNTNDPSSQKANQQHSPVPPPMPIPQPQKMVRKHTIELKTPGLGSGDGFIHTTLCRLPLECFSTQDVELEPIHRLCREATATYSGHRMLVHKFRFVETTGEGGDSNPCKNPNFDETMEAPLPVKEDSGRVGVVADGPFVMNTNETNGVFASNAERNALTTGRAPDLALHGRSLTTGGIEGLFDAPAPNVTK